MGTLNLSRQSKLVPEEEIGRWSIVIFGLGSIGSPVAKVLAKVGFKNLTVYDMDTVEEENLGPQAYDFRHLKKNKVEALKEIIKECSNIDVKAIHGQVTEETVIIPEPNTIYMCFFDSIEGRKLIYNKVKDMPCIFVDGRIGKFNIRHYLIDCSDETLKDSYLKTLPKGSGSDEVCGEKASYFINIQLAGLIVANVISFIKGKRYQRTYIGNTIDHTDDIVVWVEREGDKKIEELGLLSPEEEISNR